MPGLITDLVLSLDDKYLFFSNWLHGDLRQYDVSDPANPQLTVQVWLGGVLGREAVTRRRRRRSTAARRCCRTQHGRRRLYVTNSLYSTWDNQFYPGLKGWMTQARPPSRRQHALDPDFYVDFHEQAAGAAHEIHLPGGDCTTEIFQ